MVNFYNASGANNDYGFMFNNSQLEKQFKQVMSHFNDSEFIMINMNKIPYIFAQTIVKNQELLYSTYEAFDSPYFRSFKRVYDAEGNVIAEKTRSHSNIVLGTRILSIIANASQNKINNYSGLQKRIRELKKMQKLLDEFGDQYNIVYYMTLEEMGISL